MNNKCDNCGVGFGFFRRNKVKCAYKGCKMEICLNCCREIKKRYGIEKLKCSKCELVYCSDHMYSHGCIVSAEELQEDFQKFEDKEMEKYIEAKKKVAEAKKEYEDTAKVNVSAVTFDSAVITYSPNKKLVGISVSNIADQLSAMEKFEADGYELIKETINSNIILYKKKEEN